MSKWLYGASVQGIQGYVFKTGKLKEIVGASEIVESICTDHFIKQVNKEKFKAKNLIIGAAGNIKYVFDSEDDCKALVLGFPKSVMDKAPGITISQAVVKYEGTGLSQAINELEIKLKTQRNIAAMPYEIGFMGLERARRTGGVVFGDDKNIEKDRNDESTLLKEERSNGKTLFCKLSGIEKDKINLDDLAFDITHITKSGNNSWIAVIHADGNGLGNILQNYGTKLIEKNEFSTFSSLVKKSTEEACQVAFEKIGTMPNQKYPIRPILIGGDDVTIIIRADLALDFTIQFLKSFEEKTKANFTAELKTSELHNGLTACAGIAYVKDSYPLHYALSLSEQLCKDAKRMVKKDVPRREDQMPLSSLAFFKVQDSFVESLEAMKYRSLYAMGKISYDFGPYLVCESSKFSHVKLLEDKLIVLEKEADKKEKTKSISKLRTLISESFIDISSLEIMKVRMKSVNKELYEDLNLEHELKSNSKSILYDLILLHGLKY